MFLGMLVYKPPIYYRDLFLVLAVLIYFTTVTTTALLLLNATFMSWCLKTLVIFSLGFPKKRDRFTVLDVFDFLNSSMSDRVWCS